MTKNKEVEIERERCKAVVEKKIKAIIEYREENIKRKKRRLTFLFNRLKDDIIFLIDNEDYVRVTPEQKGANKLKKEAEEKELTHLGGNVYAG